MAVPSRLRVSRLPSGTRRAGLPARWAWYASRVRHAFSISPDICGQPQAPKYACKNEQPALSFARRMLEALKAMGSKPRMANWVEHVQAQGRYTFTREQVASETGRSFVAVQSAMRRLIEQGRVASPRRGFFVVVPPEYRVTGAPPASWFIDELMRHFKQPYYVGLLTAAALHGAAHQQPLAFQVITSKPTRAIRVGSISIRFLMNGRLAQMPTIEKQTETGTMRVATPEACAYDLVRYPAAAGHLGNVLTVLSELVEQCDKDALLRIAPLVRLPDVQRLGYLLDQLEEAELATPLYAWLRQQTVRPVLLVPHMPPRDSSPNRWFVLSNTLMESDL